jgi:Na+:H+ antiporter, NhaA family
MSLHIRIARRMAGVIVDYLLALPLGCVLALLWANTAAESYFKFSNAASFVVNEVGMAFFFGLIAKEVSEATVPGGALHPWRRAAMPMAAALGSVAVSIAAYVLFVHSVGEHMLADGWVAACAVDIPGTYIVARMIFGKEPAVPFLLLLAISADAIGLACVAALQPVADVHLLAGAVLMALALVGAAMLRRRIVRNFWPYVLGPGVLSWFALYASGVHPALALVPIIPFLPHAKRDPGLFVDSDPHAHDTLTLFARFWQYPVEAVLFFFGLANAGVPLHGLEVGSWAIPIASLLRPIGIGVATAIACAAGLHLPHRVGWRDIAVVGCIASIGLVFALFFSSAVMPPGTLLLEMKLGALITIFGALLAFIAARALRVGRYAPTQP